MRMIFRCDPRLAEHLPRPFPARTALPDWLRAMPAKAHSEIHDREIRTVKQCPPFVDAMAHGVMIPLPCDVRVERGAFAGGPPAPSPPRLIAWESNDYKSRLAIPPFVPSARSAKI